MTLSATVLFSFAFASFILAIIIEILAQQSEKKGGFALSKSADDIPAFANFCFLFVPTIVAVIYSLLWSWIDLDVKRTQPWLEMSKPDGTTAERSVFLDYPYDFIAFVPLKAARRRHWAVFYGGTVMVMIFWLITPLQSAILGSGPVDIRRQVVVSAPKVIRPASEQIGIVDQSILNEGYAITWLNQQLPPYTTANYTLLPFVVDSDLTRAASTNWTGSTTKYWTELDCWPATFTPRGPGYDFLDGRGCNATELVPYNGEATPHDPYKMQYYGYHPSDWADYWLSQTCSKAAAHQFLAIWARKKEKMDVSAVFCEASYFKQQVNATVSSVAQIPIEGSIVPTGPREVLLPTEFNSSSFEHLLGAGVSVVEMQVKREYPFGHLLEQHPQIKRFGLRWPSSPLVGFAVGLQSVTTLDVFEDDQILGQAFTKTHRLMFSLGLRRVLTNASSETATMGFLDFERHGIVVSRLYSAIVESLLVVVGIFTILLWWHGMRAPSRLAMDPASLGSLISICQNSSKLLDKFAGKGCLTDENLREAFQDKRFQLVCGCQTRFKETIIKVVDIREEFCESQRISIPDSDIGLSQGHYSPIKPLALRKEVGAMVILTMTTAIAALVYLKLEEQRVGGESLLREPIFLQILENYIPTMFATLLEPFWVLVNRLLCIIQPFKDLWNGQRSANSSINARYTSVPPQLVIWRAAKSGHLVLVAICLLALLSNLLAVGLGGLFNEKPATINTTCEVQQTMRPSFNNDSVMSIDSQLSFARSIAYESPFYIVMNNISQGTTLPPWVNKDYFFQPFTSVPGQEAEAEELTVRTRGFGVRPSCFVADTIRSIGTGPVLNYTYTRNGEPVPSCPTTFQENDLTLNRSFTGEPTGHGTAEVVRSFHRRGSRTPCEVPLVLSWSRTPSITKVDGEIETWHVVCEPIFTTSLFDVTVDRQGYVLRADHASEPSATLDDPLTTNNTDVISTYLNYILGDGMPVRWHNDSLSREFMNYLLKIHPDNANNILDPLEKPDPLALLPSIESIYRQLWAIMLHLNPQFFNTFTEPVRISGTCRKTDIRIFMDSSALVISISVLALNVAVAVVLYGFTITHFLPRMPTTIGSVLAYMAPSRAVREYDGPDSLKGATFSFGRYVGDDGRAHNRELDY
ncbi:Phosphoribosylaminoimidazole-succinocarboxamide synthase [Colletotrichum higginsianum IMI 349063]|uniref:Phosphoribosylaminoimidazole-succinocarboxamide synthase n=2 Tax=Colletotrichum higginsianum (strain IMI 349063) TaxID=759273 RepID=A0A1B7YII4_COLHI|nr:Phosphoribosylaminoimidazole-succinocarboxamide synthase [Colletotrichum higginsianum IMI 349063]OBR11889.1 Phosphoribosylaminoimidazole-succinocarboxamide synthase [Colletotrichum higginsianum IMI 349063]